MPIPPLVVSTARWAWHWQWLQLMGGLGPADGSGNYRRPDSPFGQRPPLPSGAREAGRHVLIVGRSCPWAHRAWLVWGLRRLEASIELLVVEPDPRAGRWCFQQPFLGCTTLQQLYRLAGADPGARATVPVLVDQLEKRILLGESARLIELLNGWPAAEDSLDLEPAAQREAIDRWRQKLQNSVNDGVYRCGFARHQAAYDRAESELFAVLDQAESELAGGGPWLCSGGDQASDPSLADVQLFATLVRLELVYAPLFGVSRRPLWQFPQLWAWRQRFWQLPGVAASCFADAWRRDYFGALFPLHPSGIVPAGPDLATLMGMPAAPARP